MRSRILQYKNKLATYDLLTQFPVKKQNCMPTFSFVNVIIKNIQTSDLKQVCLNLVSIQLIGNSYVIFNSQKDSFNLTLRSNGINTYFILENLFLLGYKNKLKTLSLRKQASDQSRSTVRSKNFLSIIDFFALNSNFLKSVEKASNKHLSITFSYKITKAQSSETTIYFLKSLGLPF